MINITDYPADDNTLVPQRGRRPEERAGDCHQLGSRRQPQPLRIQWTEYQRKRRVRWKFLCYAHDETFTVIDDFLVGELMRTRSGRRRHAKAHPRRWIRHLPDSIRAPIAHSSERGRLKLDSTKIQHSLTSETTGMFKNCFHVTEIKNVDKIIREGL